MTENQSDQGGGESGQADPWATQVEPDLTIHNHGLGLDQGLSSEHDLEQGQQNKLRELYEASAPDSGAEQRIRERAYQMWEAEGRPEGGEEDRWERARRALEAERG